MQAQLASGCLRGTSRRHNTAVLVQSVSLMAIRIASVVLALLVLEPLGLRAAEAPKEVSFLSADGRTMLRGFVFTPSVPGPWPAVVMMHGRSGPFSNLARGNYSGATLGMRHRQWGRFWSERGYLALHVDSFGPRGYPEGFPLGSYSDRPTQVSEQTVRPLDAYGALRYLRSRSDVIGDRIGLQGWSNGAMAGLASLDSRAAWLADPSPKSGFRAALLFYPSCIAQLKRDYRPYPPVLMFIASADEEVSPEPCRRLADQVRSRGIEHFEMVWYEGANHSFDTPTKSRQALEANRKAREDSMRRAEAFFERQLKP